MNATPKVKVLSNKVVITLPTAQHTMDAEKAIRFAHELMATAEKALRKAGRIHES